MGGAETEIDVGKKAVVKDWNPFSTLTAAIKQNILQKTTGQWVPYKWPVVLMEWVGLLDQYISAHPCPQLISPFSFL